MCQREHDFATAVSVLLRCFCCCLCCTLTDSIEATPIAAMFFSTLPLRALFNKILQQYVLQPRQILFTQVIKCCLIQDSLQPVMSSGHHVAGCLPSGNNYQRCTCFGTIVVAYVSRQALSSLYIVSNSKSSVPSCACAPQDVHKKLVMVADFLNITQTDLLARMRWLQVLGRQRCVALHLDREPTDMTSVLPCSVGV